MLAKFNRLSKDKDFDRVFKNGRSSYNQIMGIKATGNGLENNRYGILVSAKVSKKSVERNKIKRQLKAIIIKQTAKTIQGNDIVIICLPEILNKTFKEIEQSMSNLFKKFKLYQ